MPSSKYDGPVRWWHVLLVVLSVWWMMGMPLYAQTEASLQAKLGGIADTAKVEHVYCVENIPSGTTPGFFALEATMERNDHEAIAVACMDMLPKASAVWHNHVFVASDVAPRAENMCYFTKTDQHTFLTYEKAPIAVVQVNSAVKCWWTREQVLEGWSQNLTPLPAIPEQMTK
jgi:hypothetical protein